MKYIQSESSRYAHTLSTRTKFRLIDRRQGYYSVGVDTLAGFSKFCETVSVATARKAYRYYHRIFSTVYILYTDFADPYASHSVSPTAGGEL